MKSPRRSTESLAVGARNGLATYDRLEGGQSKGSVYGAAATVGSPHAAALVRALVLAATAATLGHGDHATGGRAVRRITSAGPSDRPRLRDGDERRVSRAAGLARGRY